MPSAFCTYSENACDSLRIITDSDNTTLKMHQYSTNVLFSTPSGFTDNNLECDRRTYYINKINAFANLYAMLAFKPAGGSFVIFTPFCSTDTGNTSDG